MRKGITTTIIIIMIVVTLISCKTNRKKAESKWSELPEITALENLKQTGFVPTLENLIPEKKNIIYAPSFLFAWNKMEEELKSKVVVSDNNSHDFKLLTNSKSYINSLKDNEYSIDVNIEGSEIRVEAFFNKSLPFENKFQKLKNPITFGNKKVSAFGMYYFDMEIIKYCKLLFYDNDNKFILKLTPKDIQQEIILVKGLSNVNSLSDVVNKTNELIKKGSIERLNSKQSWKYEISLIDNFAIPIIKFNIGTNYTQLTGQTFKTADNKNHKLYEVYQRTGFILNENGAVVESQAIAIADSVEAVAEKRQPKNMVFDKRFYIIIKRIDKINPYFVMQVDNDELMIKE